MGFDAKRRGYNSMFAGSIAGAIASVVCSPLDVAKVRMQIQGAQLCAAGLMPTLHSIAREEGVRGFYRGLNAGLVNIPIFWGIYWYSYDRLKHCLSKMLPNCSTPVIHVVSAISAGAVADVATNPFWVVRTRLQTLSLFPDASSNHSTLTMFRTIYQKEGVRAFYKGLTASFLGLSHVAIQFPLYEHLKEEMMRYRRVTELNSFDILLTATGAKLVASVITYPHEVLRSRLQSSRDRMTLVGLTRKILAEEGLRSFYCGIRVNIMRALPATMCTFVTYESVIKYVESRNAIV